MVNYSTLKIQVIFSFVFSSTINAFAYYGTLKFIDSRKLFVKRDQGVDQSSYSCAPNLTSQCCHSCEFLEMLGLENSSTSTINSLSAVLDFYVFPKMKKHLRHQCFHSNDDVSNDVKKYSMFSSG
jgi:hypothetical protein